MESRKSYFTTQLKKCDYRSGSRCRYYWERDDGRNLQEAVDAFQGSFVGEQNFHCYALQCMWCREEVRDQTPIFKCLGGFHKESVSIVEFKILSKLTGKNIHFYHFSLWVLLLFWGGSCAYLAQPLPWLPCWRGWDELRWGGDVILHAYPNKSQKRCREMS